MAFSDEEAPVPSDDTTIEISVTAYEVTDANYTLLQNTMDPLGPSNEYGVDLYEQTLNLI